MMEKKDIRGIKKGAFFGRNEGLLLLVSEGQRTLWVLP
jgi:hypothetical protein